MRPQAAALKALLDETRLQVMPGCGDGMGARLIEEAGFRTGFVSGSSISAMRLAMPDMDLLSFPEMADAVETCIAAAPPSRRAMRKAFCCWPAPMPAPRAASTRPWRG